jgi:purine-binding chemotaxis protein CheW
MAEEQLFCTFFVDTFFIGINVSKVQEIIRYQEMTEVPLASREIRGLINLRGQIVTAIDLRRRMGLVDRPPEQCPMNVVIRDHENEAVSLLVDKVGEVISVVANSFETPPETLHETARQLITGVYKLNAKLMLVLDTEKTIEFVSTPTKVNRL